MKTDEEGVTDLTQEAGLDEPKDSELFANLSSRAPTASGLHRRPRESLAQVARLGALVSSAPPGRTLPPPGPGVSTVPPAPVARAVTSSIQSGEFDDDELTPGRKLDPARKGGFSLKVKLAVALAAVAVFGVAAAVASSVVGRGGSLIVTATGPGSSEIPGVEVLVDGVVQCGTSPCKVASIAAGTHMVSVRAKGFNPTASLAVTVSARTEGVLNVTLSPAAAAAPAIPVAAAPAPPRPASAAPAQSVASKPVETRPAPAVPAAKAALGAAAQPRSTAGAAQTPATASATNAPASTDKGDSGTLRIVSLPVASVLLDLSLIHI